MIDDVSDIADFYNCDPQSEEYRLSVHQLEHDLTWRFLDHFLPRQGSVLEVGAATGQYTLELARRGYAVTAVDLSEALIGECRKRTAAAGFAGRVRCVTADARDLTNVSETEFDAVLLMGPLYHLVAESDRKRAIQEASNHMKSSGIIFSAWISRLGMLCDLLKDKPEWIEDPKEVRSILENGRRPDDYPRGGFRGYHATVPEIAPVHEAMGFETIALAAVEPVIAADDECYTKLQGARRELWLDLFQTISGERSIIGASRHLLYVGRKR
jgi:SAM-dependent methyltransferase